MSQSSALKRFVVKLLGGACIAAVIHGGSAIAAAQDAPKFGGDFATYPIDDGINQEIFVDTIKAKRDLNCLFSVNFQLEYDAAVTADAKAYAFTTAITIDGGQSVGGSQFLVYGNDTVTPSPSARTSRFQIAKGKNAKLSLFITNWARTPAKVYLEHSYACF